MTGAFPGENKLNPHLDFHIWILVKQKVQIKSWAYGAMVECNFQEIDHWGQFLKNFAKS